MKPRFRFRLSTLLWLTALIAMGFAWWKDRSELQERQQERIYDRDTKHALEVAYYWKQHMWRLTDHVPGDTAVVETELSTYPITFAFTGPMVTVSSGLKLRLPRDVVRALCRALDRESDTTAIIYIAWAVERVHSGHADYDQ
jgi:hypothetical protein